MSQANIIEVAQRSVEAWSRGDTDAVLAHLCFDVEAVPVGAALEGKVCRGHDEVRAWLQAQSDVWETFLICAEEFKEVGTEQLVVSGHWEAVGRSGVEVSAPATWVFRFRGGKIAYWQAYTSRASALEAVELRD
jgi:ketosteroid isomerase-like protein